MSEPQVGPRPPVHLSMHDSSAEFHTADDVTARELVGVLLESLPSCDDVTLTVGAGRTTHRYDADLLHRSLDSEYVTGVTVEHRPDLEVPFSHISISRDRLGCRQFTVHPVLGSVGGSPALRWASQRAWFDGIGEVVAFKYAYMIYGSFAYNYHYKAPKPTVEDFALDGYVWVSVMSATLAAQLPESDGVSDRVLATGNVLVEIGACPLQPLAVRNRFQQRLSVIMPPRRVSPPPFPGYSMARYTFAEVDGGVELPDEFLEPPDT